MSIGERIKAARTIAGMSQRDLAEAADVSAMAISKYERDMDMPGSAVLLRVAKALNVKFEYFFRRITVTLNESPYRRKTSLPVGQEPRILGQIQEWLERYLDIEALLDRTPELKLPSKKQIEALEQVETEAIAVRELWNLGLDPIENLMEECEERGIKVGLIEAHESFDALTLIANEVSPVIVIRRDMPGDRQRFCLAHELGHLLFDSTILDAEKVANRFAGAFLVPEPAAKLELGLKRRTLSMRELHLLKQKYGLSMQAWIYRAKDVGILSLEDFSAMFKRFSQQRWRHEEPGTALLPEQPQRFERLVRLALSEDVIGYTRAAELLGVSPLQLVEEEDKGEADDGVSPFSPHR